MESSGKRKRGNDSGGGYYSSGDDDGDRLSALPDSLLHHIMSFMKARQVAQTCVLSTRWRHLWRSTTCLDVDQSEFETPGARKQYPDYETWEKFEDFMDTILSPGNVSVASLYSLRLKVSYGLIGGEGRSASRWIRRGIKYPHDQEPAAAGVHRLTIAKLPYNSWRLGRLHLCNIDLCGLFADHVRTRCQSLEDLELTSCRCEFHAIASGSLKNLVLKCCTLHGLNEIVTPALKSLHVEGGNRGINNLKKDGRRPLAITAPALASMFLHVTAHNSDGGFSLGEMPSLAKASVLLWDNKIVERFKILGSGVASVITHLEVSVFSQTMVLGEGSGTFIQFDNLRTLVLNQCDLSDDFQNLLHRLHCQQYSNDTKKRKGSRSKNAEPTPCANLVDVPCKNLKLTHIIYKEDDIRQLIELLLRISGNLPNNCIKLTKAP